MKCFTRSQTETYADGELPPGEARRFDVHLSSCPACRSLLERVLKCHALLRAAGVPRASEEAASCPAGETLAAFMEGHIADREERKRVAAHVAACGACAVRAAEAHEAARLAGILEARRLERPPRRLSEEVRRRLCGAEPALIGELVASLRGLLARFRSLAGEASPGPALAFVAESSMPYPTGAGKRTLREKGEAGRAPKRKKRQSTRVGAKGSPVRKGMSLPSVAGAASEPADVEREITRPFSRGDLSVRLSLGPAGNKAIECTVLLTNRKGKPLPFVPVEMRKGTATLDRTPTGPAGEAVFGALVAGNYQFFIRRGAGARVGLTLS